MKSLALISAGALGIGGAVWWSLSHPPRAMAKVNPVQLERMEADKLYGAEPDRAKAEYAEFVEKHKGSADKKVQDEVAAARLRLGYLAARSKDFGEARHTFLEAEKEYKGAGTMGSDFGGLKDQAAYQAAVCLMGEKKSSEALVAFRDFIKEYPLSPLVHAAHRRLEMLDPGSQSEHDALLQSAVTAQEKHIRFETSVCGPKVIAYLLEKLGKPGRGYKELARLCGTTDDGTTLEGMRKGLKAVGLESFGYELNRSDLLRLKPNSILLLQDHYVALIGFTPTHALIYDPVKGGEDKYPLPKADQTDFTIPVLTLETLTLEPGELK